MFEIKPITILCALVLFGCNRSKTKEGAEVNINQPASSIAEVVTSANAFNMHDPEKYNLEIKNKERLLAAAISRIKDLDVPPHSPHPNLEWEVEFSVQKKEGLKDYTFYFLRDGTLINVVGDQKDKDVLEAFIKESKVLSENLSEKADPVEKFGF